VLCTKLDAACDRQATVFGRVLTTLGDDRGAVANRDMMLRSLRSEVEKSSRGNYAYFLVTFNYCRCVGGSADPWPRITVSVDMTVLSAPRSPVGLGANQAVRL